MGAVALVIVALVAAGLAFDGGSADEGAAASTTTTTTRRTATTRPSTTTRPTTTTTFPIGPVLSPTVDGILVMGSGGATTWRWVDLASGELGEVEVGLNVDAWSALAVRGGIVTVTDGEAVLLPVPTGESRILGPAAQVFAGDDDDHVWLVQEPGEGSTVTALLVDLGADVLAEVVVPQPWVNGSTRGGLVFNAGGRTYLATPDGVRPIAQGEVHGVGRGGVVVRTCTDAARCSFRRLDAVTGRSVRLELAADPPSGVDATIAGDGRTVLVPYGPAQVFAVEAFAADGSALGIVSDRDLQGRPVWLPGDGGLLVPTYDGVLHTWIDGEGLHSTEVESLGRFRTEALFLIPG